MTGHQLAEYLKTLPATTLEQQILFQVNVSTDPIGYISAHVPIVAVHIVDKDHLITPDGLVSSEEAMEAYNEWQDSFAAGECTEEEAQEYLPFLCPKILTQNQLLLKLQWIQAYTEKKEPELTEEAKLTLYQWGVRGEA